MKFVYGASANGERLFINVRSIDKLYIKQRDIADIWDIVFKTNFDNTIYNLCDQVGDRFNFDTKREAMFALRHYMNHHELSPGYCHEEPLAYGVLYYEDVD